MAYKTYLFDFDGTLVNSMPTFGSVMLRILDENGVKYPSDIVKIITPLGYAGTARYFINELGCKHTEEELLDRMAEYMADAYKYTIEAKPHVIDGLIKLKKAGASLNVLTASPHSALDPCLKRIGIWELFDNVWSSDDFPTTKAEPVTYKTAAERMGVPVDSVLFLDDNITACKTAMTAGMDACGVYDDSSKEAEADMRAVCTHYVKDFRELSLL